MLAARKGKRLVSAQEWFSGGERLAYDPERASFDDGSPLRVFVRKASGALARPWSAINFTEGLKKNSGSTSVWPDLPLGS